jgi:hypothetical protein
MRHEPTSSLDDSLALLLAVVLGFCLGQRFGSDIFNTAILWQWLF